MRARCSLVRENWKSIGFPSLGNKELTAITGCNYVFVIDHNDLQIAYFGVD